MPSNQEGGWQGKGPRQRSGDRDVCACDMPETPWTCWVGPRVDMPGWVGSQSGERGVYEPWAEVEVVHESTEGAEKESRFLIYYLWALKCMTTRQK